MKKNQKKVFILTFALFTAFFAAHAETQSDNIFENQKIEDGDFYKIEREPSKKEIEDENSKFFESVCHQLLGLNFVRPKTPQKPQNQPETPTVAEAEQKMDAAINLRKKFIDLGMGYKGIEYVWGGKTPRPGFDCSGLVSYTAKQSLGIDIKGNAQDIYNHTSPVSLGDALPGDLIFFKGPADTRITHVGIYLGKNPGENDFGKQNLFLNAASAGPRTGVIISGLNENYWKKTFYGCGRIIPEI